MHTQHIRTPMLTRVLVTLTTTLLATSACDPQDDGAAQDTEADALLEEEDEVVDEDLELAAPERDEDEDAALDPEANDLVLEIDPQASTETNWFSEEGLGMGECDGDEYLTEAKCSGSYCDSMKMRCEPLAPAVFGAWHETISEEGPSNFTICPFDGMIDRIHCSGSYCDNLQVHCGFPFVPRNECSWTDWVSEEQNAWTKLDGRFAAGIQCKGRYCDSIRLYACDMG